MFNLFSKKSINNINSKSKEVYMRDYFLLIYQIIYKNKSEFNYEDHNL